jgi:hypothetical protein
MKKNKKLIIAVVVVAVLIAAFAIIYAVTRPSTTEGSKTITVTVVHQDESSKDFTYHTDAEYLGDVLLSEGLIDGTESEYGLYVTEVDGETADWDADGAYWAFYVGDEYASLGVDATPISDGDSFSLVYTIGY